MHWMLCVLYADVDVFKSADKIRHSPRPAAAAHTASIDDVSFSSLKPLVSEQQTAASDAVADRLSSTLLDAGGHSAAAANAVDDVVVKSKVKVK